MNQPILGATALVFAMFLQPANADNRVPAQTEAAPSKPLIRLALPDLRLAGSTPAPAAAALRDLFASQMQTGAIGAKNLESSLPVQALPEARQAGCGSILFITATQVRPTAKLGFLRRALANAGTSAGGSIPVGDSAGSSVLRSVTMTGVYSAAQLVTAVKANDEIRLDFRLDSAAGRFVLDFRASLCKSEIGRRGCVRAAGGQGLERDPPCRQEGHGQRGKALRRKMICGQHSRLILILIGSAGVVGAAVESTPTATIPLCPGLTIVTAVSQAGG